MGYFGITRNIWTSVYDYLIDNFAYFGYDDVDVVKSFANSEIKSLPFVVVKIDNTLNEKVEIGTNSTMRNFNIIIDIYSTSAGSVFDLKDLVLKFMKNGCPLYSYMISQGTLVAKIPDGKIYTNRAIREQDLNANSNNIARFNEREQFRQRLIVPCTTLKVEKSEYIPREVTEMEIIKVTKVAGENLGAYQAVVMLSDKKLYIGNYTSDDLSNVIGLSAGNYLKDEDANVVVFGEVENFGWNFTAGLPVFLDEDGLLIQTAPTIQTGDNYIIKIGTALTDSTLLVKPSLEKTGVM